MTDQEAKQLVASAAVLWSNLSVVPDLTWRVWQKSFSTAKYGDVEIAILHLSRTHQGNFPPTVPQIHAAIRELTMTDEERMTALEAWETVLKVARIHHDRRAGKLSERTSRALQIVGGWFTFGMTSDRDLPFLKKDFCIAYDSLSERDRQSNLGREDAAKLLKSLESKRLEKGDMQVLKIGEMQKENHK